MADRVMEPREPKPGCKIQVIGAGLPWTATNSFCAALEYLLDGPPYHAGYQYASDSDERHIWTWIDVIEARPYRTAAQKEVSMKRMAKQLDGYVSTSDPPLSQLVPELMELYPDAKVICTVRDPEKWAKSMVMIAKLAQPSFIRLLFFWIPSIRYMHRLSPLLGQMFEERYGMSVPADPPDVALANAKMIWERHNEWLEAIVPKEKLFYFDVKDGWEPLCKALDVPVPKDVPFPNVNDAKAIETFFKKQAVKGLVRWGMAVGVLGLTVYAGVFFWGQWR